MIFPRILIATSSNFNLTTGSGITLTNLFKGWPIDRIANLHEDSNPEDRSVCGISYRLTNDEVPWSWPFSLFQEKSVETTALVNGSQAENPGVRISRMVFGDGIPRQFVATSRLSQWLKEFRPEVIYSFLGSMAQVRVASALTRQLGLPLVVHIMDDWPAVIYRRGFFGPVLRRIVMSEFKGLLRNAKARLAISDAMCKDYEQRFGYTFTPFHNAIDMSEWQPRARQAWTAGRPFVIRYAGSIVEEAQRDSLREICRAVSNLRQAGEDIEIWIHAPKGQRAYLEQERFEGLSLWDSPDPVSIVELLSSADVLVLPFNFDEHSAEYMRLSMPTKVPAYMASGSPILVYGPASIATVQYALQEGWAYVLFQRGVHVVQAALRRLMTDQHLREQQGRRAQQLAAARHDSARVRAAFQSILAE